MRFFNFSIRFLWCYLEVCVCVNKNVCVYVFVFSGLGCCRTSEEAGWSWAWWTRWWTRQQCIWKVRIVNTDKKSSLLCKKMEFLTLREKILIKEKQAQTHFPFFRTLYTKQIETAHAPPSSPGKLMQYDWNWSAHILLILYTLLKCINPFIAVSGWCVVCVCVTLQVCYKWWETTFGS